MQNRVYVSYAKRGRENYQQGLPRLAASILAHDPTAQARFVCPEFQTGAQLTPTASIVDWEVPPHAQIPYGFKPAIMGQAFSLASTVMWCDSTITLQADPSALFQKAEHNGVVVFANPGCPMAHWTTDDCLETIGCPQDKAKTLDQIMACAIIIDYSHPIGKMVFDRWQAHALDGVSFNGGRRSNRLDFRDHRHDQSVLTWVCYSCGITPEPYGALCYYGDREKFSAIFTNQGLYQ